MTNRTDSSEALMDAPFTSKPQASEPCGHTLNGHLLTGRSVLRATLTPTDRDQMYALLATYFQSTDRATFDADLDEKEHVLLLRERATGHIRGFSTLLHLRLEHEGRQLHALFSGDTIVHAEFRGESIVGRLWLQTFFAAADRLNHEEATAEVFWFLICSGYKTFRFLPVFFRNFHPHPGPEPDSLKAVLDAFGTARFGPGYDPFTGIVRLAAAAPLRPGVADLTEGRLRDPMVRFFTERNPGHAQGDELACLTRLTRANLTAAGHRMLNADAPAAGRAGNNADPEP